MKDSSNDNLLALNPIKDSIWETVNRNTPEFFVNSFVMQWVSLDSRQTFFNTKQEIMT